MSLMKSLARVAAGIMLAKGIGTMMKNAQQGRSSTGGGAQTGHQPSGGILDDLVGKSSGRPASDQSASAQHGSGGLGDILGQILGGRPPGAGGGAPYGGSHSPGTSGGGLGGLLDQLTAGRTGSTTASSGGLGGSLGQILAGGAAGGLGGVLGDLLGGPQARANPTPSGGGGGLAQKDSQPNNDASFGEVLNEALVNGGEPDTKPTPEQNALAGLILRAMIQAAKSDGKIDEAEQSRLMKEFGELDEEERQFIRAQMAAPVDAEALAREVPQGLGPQIYLMSLMAIDFDSRQEAEYLHSFATALGLDKATVNGIHEKVGATNLYA
ncbi:tellurite resistance TerB family protein [Paracoccus sp. MBLB3053]|uniref:Tellurite resistance TerB family protein n=1 Tax=Paracoccus aurantius TaxID=3073814 RepID=A0ABU2HQ86_9RHOB|nr:tellurite resistance TerB family protein [Paracoccus sp. MBLB3053]MDS9466444.1 tellurite resistance TerB family protein [Paracoccus sp. MBLB3053]